MYLTLENWRVSGLKLKMSQHCFFFLWETWGGGGGGDGDVEEGNLVKCSGY